MKQTLYDVLKKLGAILLKKYSKSHIKYNKN